MNWQIRNKMTWYRLFVSILMLGSTAGMAYYYFNTGPETASPIEFYEALPFNELSLTELDLQRVVNDGDGSEFETMAVASAFRRFQIDPSTGGIFDSYINEYNNGLWKVPDTETWRKAFTQHRDTWMMKRRDFTRSRVIVPRPRLLANNEQQIVEFANGTYTYMLGSKLKFTIGVPSRSVTDQPTHATWVLTAPDGEREVASNVARWDIETITSGSMQLATLNVTLSDEVPWLRRDRIAVTLAVTGQRSAEWKVQSVEFKDN